MYYLFFVISFLASIIGAICGIGGGIIIKPVLDAFGSLDVATINFLSGCTVLSMTLYSVIKSLLSKEKSLNIKIATPLAIGAAIGGFVGKELFSLVAKQFTNPNKAGAVQAGLLLLITLGTLIYTINKEKIKTHKVNNIFACIIIGLFLGCMSSFLGIGGGPINLVILFFFFTMSTKEAAQNSLYIILFSQATSTIKTLMGQGVGGVDISLLIGMVICGILGGICGRAINKKIDDHYVDKLFIGLMVVIICINAYNIYKFI